MKTKVAIVAVVAVAVGGAVMLWPKKKESPTPAPTAPAASAVEKPKPVVRTKAVAPALGLLGRYDVSYKMDMRHPAGVLHFTLAGRLDVVQSTTDEEVRTALLQNVSSGFVGDNPGGDLTADPSLSFTAPWRMRLLPSGAVSEVSFATDTPQSARVVLQQIAVFSQLVESETPGDLSWKTVETDPNATYEVQYKRNNLFGFQKSWTAKAGVAGDDAIFQGEGATTLTTSARAVEAYETMLSQRVKLSSSREVKTIIKISVTRASGDVSPEVLAAADAQDKKSGFQPLDKNAFPRPTEEMKDEQRVAGRSFERIVQDIEKADAGGSWQLRRSFGFDLASLIRLDPTQIPKTIAQIRTATKEPVRRTLLESLANAATPQAQQGLAQVMTDETMPKEVSSSATRLVAFIPEPTPELLETLDKQSRSATLRVRGDAIVALSNALSNNKEAGAKNADELLSTFIDRGMNVLAENGVLRPDVYKGQKASALPTPQPGQAFARRDVVTWVQALGSTNDPKALPLLADALVFKRDRGVRAQAALALETMPAKEAAALLGERLLNDPSHIVRHHALSTITNLGPEFTLEITKDALFKDDEPMVRAEAAFAIGHWANKKPELKAVLDEAFQREDSRLVIETILDMTVPGRGYKEGIKKVAIGRTL